MALDAYTKSLLHMDGANDSTSIIDVSGKAWTAYGDAKLKTAQHKFGSSSCYFDGAGDYINTPDHADFYTAGGNFTIDFWLYTASGTFARICGQGNSVSDYAGSANFITIMSSNSVRVTIPQAASYIHALSPTITINDSVWHHVAMIRNGNNLYCAVDGTLGGATDVTGITALDGAYPFTLGRWGDWASDYFNGYIDEFRFSKGIARWTVNFTPPARPYVTTPQIIIY